MPWPHLDRNMGVGCSGMVIGRRCRPGPHVGHVASLTPTAERRNIDSAARFASGITTIRQTAIMERVEMCGDRMDIDPRRRRQLATTGGPGTVQPPVVATKHAGLVLATPCPAGRRTAGQCQPQDAPDTASAGRIMTRREDLT